MRKLSLYILLFGFILGATVGALMCSIALDHNPQMEYTMNPEGLILVFLSWAGICSLPFIVLTAIIEIVFRMKKRKSEK